MNIFCSAKRQAMEKEKIFANQTRILTNKLCLEILFNSTGRNQTSYFKRNKSFGQALV